MECSSKTSRQSKARESSLGEQNMALLKKRKTNPLAAVIERTVTFKDMHHKEGC